MEDNNNNFSNKKRKPEKNIENLTKKEEFKRKNEEGWKNLIHYDKDLHNEKFEFYYKNQLSQYLPTQEDFNNFLSKLKEKLPTVFRISKSHPFFNIYKSFITNNEFIQSLINNNNENNNNNNNENNKISIQPKNLTTFEEWKNLVYNINIPRMELKKSNELSKFHKFIQQSVDSGLISRQETVSMIPPMLLQSKKGEKIFDMCAAPGSKTAQFLETFYDNYDFLDKNSYKKDTGFVLANDNNPKRTYLMVHQLQRLNTAGMVVICHDAQIFPNLYDENNNKILFDKILCDVPCSSDAVMRKLPHKWKNWNTKDSFSLHKLQIQILKRAIMLLKVGGYLIYSTCSLNPIENESVVAEVMRNYNKDDELEIINTHKYFEGTDIKIHDGLEKWKVFVEKNDDKNKIIDVDEINENDFNKYYKNIIDKDCFPPKLDELKTLQLKNCVRLFPHDSDTSGFFITLIRKNKEINNVNNNNNNQKNTKNKSYYEFVKEKFKEDFEWIVNYYGIDNDFPGEQLVTFSNNNKKINFISKGVCDLLKSDNKNKVLKLQNAGVKMFNKEKIKNENNKNNNDYCKYRICQDGLMYILPFIHKNIFYFNEELFIKLLKNGEILKEEINNESIKNIINNKAHFGCIIIVNSKKLPENYENIEHNFLKENFIDAICCFNAQIKITTMINKEHQFVYNLKYNINK